MAGIRRLHIKIVSHHGRSDYPFYGILVALIPKENLVSPVYIMRSMSTGEQQPSLRKYRHGPSPGIRWSVHLLALAALSISAFLSWLSLTGSSVPGCGTGEFDCNYVLTSGWSKWFALPVSINGVLVYAGIFLASWLITPRYRPSIQRFGWFAMIPLAILAAMAGIWFTVLQVSLGTICLYCLLTHLCGLAVFVLLLFNLPLESRAEQPTSPQMPGIMPQGGSAVGTPTAAGITPTNLTLLVCLSALGMILLVTGQLLSKHSTYEIVELDGENIEVNDMFGTQPVRPHEEIRDTVLASLTPNGGGTATYNVGETSTSVPAKNRAPIDNPAPTEDGNTAETTSPYESGDLDGLWSETIALKPVARPERILEIMPNTPLMNVYDHPTIGNPEAIHIMVEVLAYTCKTCRKMHHRLEAVRRRYGEQIAYVIRPVSLNTRCNHHVKKDHPMHKDACRITQLALAVWHADDSKFEIYHDYLMNGEKAPSVNEAASVAIDLIGKEVLIAELRNPDVKELEEENNELVIKYADKLPTLVFGRRKMQGLPKNNVEMFKLLEKALHVRPIKNANQAIASSGTDLAQNDENP